MMAFFVQELKAGIYTTFNSFNLVRKYPTMLLYATFIPLSQLFLIPLLLRIAYALPAHPLINFVITVIIGFIATAFFNIVYFAASTYFFKICGYLPPFISVMSALRSQMANIMIWTALTTCAIAIIKLSFSTLFSISDSHMAVVLFDYCWWIINLLLIPIMASSNFTLFESLKTVVTYVRSKWIFLVSAGISFYLIKKLIDMIFYTVLFFATPRFLIGTHLISYEQLTPAHPQGLFALFAVGVLMSALLSIIMMTAQTILMTLSYARYNGKAVDSLLALSWKQLLITDGISIIAFSLTLFILNSLLLLMSIHIPHIGAGLMFFFGKGNL